VAINLTYDDKIAILDLGDDENRFSPGFLDEFDAHLDEVIGAGDHFAAGFGGVADEIIGENRSPRVPVLSVETSAVPRFELFDRLDRQQCSDIALSR